MWRTIGLSVAPPIKPVCQDANRWQSLDADTLLMTVADGAGTAARAKIGADVASRAALDYMTEHADATNPLNRPERWPIVLHGALESAIVALRTEAEKHSVPLDHYATTLIGVIATPDLVVVAQVGDGMVFIVDTEGAILRLTIPQRGEYSNETCMLTSLFALDNIQTAVWQEPITGIAAMTDGLLPITTTLPFYKPYSPFFTNLFTFLRNTEDREEAHRKLKGFLLSDRVQNGTGDDLTLLLAVL